MGRERHNDLIMRLCITLYELDSSYQCEDRFYSLYTSIVNKSYEALFSLTLSVT